MIPTRSLLDVTIIRTRTLTEHKPFLNYENQSWHAHVLALSVQKMRARNTRDNAIWAKNSTLPISMEPTPFKTEKSIQLRSASPIMALGKT